MTHAEMEELLARFSHMEVTARVYGRHEAARIFHWAGKHLNLMRDEPVFEIEPAEWRRMLI